jgi:hypothetical protein
MNIKELEDTHEKIAWDADMDEKLGYIAHAKLSIEFAISILDECYKGINPDNSTVSGS